MVFWFKGLLNESFFNIFFISLKSSSFYPVLKLYYMKTRWTPEWFTEDVEIGIESDIGSTEDDDPSGFIDTWGKALKLAFGVDQ